MVEAIKYLISLIVGIMTFTSYIPQIVKLLKTKKSEDISINSQIQILTQFVLYTILLVLDDSSFKLIFLQAFEDVLVLYQLILVIKYRPKTNSSK